MIDFGKMTKWTSSTSWRSR